MFRTLHSWQYLYIPFTVFMVALVLYFVLYVHGYMKSCPSRVPLKLVKTSYSHGYSVQNIWSLCPEISYWNIFRDERQQMEKTSKWIVNSVISSMYQLIKLDCSCATSFAPLLKTSQLSRPTGRSPRFGSFLPVFICQRSFIITCHLFIIIIIITSIHNRNRFF